MEKIHKIPVDFARRIPHKVDVHINKIVDYEYSKLKKIHSYPRSGTIRTDVIVTTAITLVLLIIIAATIILVL